MLSKELILAIYNGEIVSILHWLKPDKVNDLDMDGRSALFHAILAKSHQIFNLLIANHAYLNIKDKTGWSPLHYAAQNYEVEMAQLLIENGADIELKDDNGNTPLWRAAFSSRGKGDVIKLLLLSGADPNNINDSGISPAKIASTIVNYDVKQFFNNLS